MYVIKNVKTNQYVRGFRAGGVVEYTDKKDKGSQFKSVENAAQALSGNVKDVAAREHFKILAANYRYLSEIVDTSAIEQLSNEHKESGIVNDFLNLILLARLERDKYIQELSAIDLEEQDILHYIEFNNFNAAQGYKLSKILKATREKRRAIKNKIAEYQKIVANSEDIDLDKLFENKPKSYTNKILKDDNIYNYFNK